jgi:diguanylate cyclase (GGDEF)-like protein
VASIIKASLARKTDYAFRYGGEEFAILLPHTDENGAITFTEKLIEMIRSSPWKSKDEIVYITISVGISYCSEDLKKVDIESLINRADKALYDAKANGRDQLKISEEVYRHE